MTGTAMTEREEFGNTYCLDVVEIPTNKPVIRKDHPDAVYRTAAGKLRAIVEKIEDCHDRGNQCWWVLFLLRIGGAVQAAAAEGYPP